VLYPPELHALGVEDRFRLQTTGYRLQNGSPGGIPALDAELEPLAPLRRLVGHYREAPITHGGLRRLRDPFGLTPARPAPRVFGAKPPDPPTQSKVRISERH
jgi:hypothetical protein